jgi:Ca2+-binding EF-hand superfamily protein
MSLAYRKITIPRKLDWSKKFEVEPAITAEVLKELEKALTDVAQGKKLNPSAMELGLKRIGFHKEYPEIYKIVQGMALQKDISGEELTVQEFIDYISETIGGNTTRAGVNVTFEALKDEKSGDITAESIMKVVEELGDDLSIEDVKYMLQTISQPYGDPNINSEEFYYIMTKKPSDAAKINSLTKEIEMENAEEVKESKPERKRK